MPEQVQAWKCERCGMTSIYKANVVRHENNHCPNYKSCRLCSFYDQDWTTIYNPLHGGNPGSTDYDELIMTCCRYCDADHKECIQLLDRQNNCRYFEPLERNP